jgi:hypothetical protein
MSQNVIENILLSITDRCLSTLMCQINTIKEINSSVYNIECILTLEGEGDNSS